MERKQHLQDKLQDMRRRYKNASPSYRKFLEVGAKLLHFQLDSQLSLEENRD